MKSLLIALLAAVPLSAQNPGGNTVYGDDDRRDVYQVTNPAVKKLAESTVALFQSANVKLEPGKTTADLVTSPYGEEMGLCPEEPFFSQRTGAFCSGSLVAPDLIMTAGHCVRSAEACKDTKFVFGFGLYKEGPSPVSAAAGDVYGCAELLGREEVGAGADWALVRLDRPVAGHRPLQLNRAGEAAKGAKLFVIGHPAGLPTKVAGGAAVRDPSPGGYFVANLDTFGGNSGSAVFNANTGLIEGILVRGEQDYEYRGSCRVSKSCPNDGCRGEDVTKISALAAKIPPAWSPARVVTAPAFSALLSSIKD